jgi:bifunctional non-homologous end joining protein LigD
MLATSRPGLVPDERWAVEPKLDGWRGVISFDDCLTIRTRTARDVTGALPELAGLAEVLPPGTVLDAELVAGAGLPEDFYRVAGSMAARHRTSPLAIAVFDVMAYGGETVTGLPYTERRAILDSLDLTGPAWSTVPSFDGPPAPSIEACMAAGLEGVVLKLKTSPYLPGRRTKSWVKLKSPTWRTEHAPRRHDH